MSQQDASASDPHVPGDPAELDACFPLVYDELRRLAGRYLRAEDVGHTLQPTALVHEAYLRLVGQRNVDWRNRAQFLGIAAEMMRRILVNHAVARRTAKRGGGAPRIALDETLRVLEADDVDLLALDGALGALAAVDARASRVVELRFFGGLGIEETAEVLGVSPATVKRDWTVARAWLRRELRAA
jgi:RNA polymerase sigma factor (TIGR02999 family)